MFVTLCNQYLYYRLCPKSCQRQWIQKYRMSSAPLLSFRMFVAKDQTTEMAEWMEIERTGLLPGLPMKTFLILHKRGIDEKARLLSILLKVHFGEVFNILLQVHWFLLPHCLMIFLSLSPILFDEFLNYSYWH